jgi:hypothetical protein
LKVSKKLARMIISCMLIALMLPLQLMVVCEAIQNLQHLKIRPGVSSLK